MTKIESARDMLLLELDAGIHDLYAINADIPEEEYFWEPMSLSEQTSALLLPHESKRVWCVFQREGH